MTKDAMLALVRAVHRSVMANVRLGTWMSAALDDPDVCDAMKADIREWFSSGQPPNFFTDMLPLIESHAARADRAEAALRKILEGTIPRPVGEQYFPDRVSMNDRCVHDVWMYEDCGKCIDDFIEAALEPKP